MSSFRLSLAIPPPNRTRRSGSGSSLHLARSRGRSSSNGSDDDASTPGTPGSGSGGLRKSSLTFTPVRPTFSPNTPAAVSARSDVQTPLTAESLISPIASPRPSHEAPWNDFSFPPKSPEERTPRVQFADAPRVAVFDAESEIDVDLDLEMDAFERPIGREMFAIVLSFASILVFAIAAGLTTVFDWVL